jgi:hypothetical protein
MTIAPVTSVNVKQHGNFAAVLCRRAWLQNEALVDSERVEDDPDRRIRWCWLELGDAAVMVQEFLLERFPKERDPSRRKQD